MCKKSLVYFPFIFLLRYVAINVNARMSNFETIQMGFESLGTERYPKSKQKLHYLVYLQSRGRGLSPTITCRQVTIIQKLLN